MHTRAHAHTHVHTHARTCTLFFFFFLEDHSPCGGHCQSGPFLLSLIQKHPKPRAPSVFLPSLASLASLPLPWGWHGRRRGFRQRLGLVRGIFGLLMMRFILCRELTSVLSRVGHVSTSALLREGVLVNPCFQQESTACVSAAHCVSPSCTLTDSCSCPRYSLSHPFLSRTHVPVVVGAL